ncbi:MAG: hypothetical protein E7158_04280 [Firmicutes bacterium]|nr:hypothetical protein [Bacillota bacterium]
MKNISKTLNIISVLVFIVAFFTKGYSINRLILIILGIVISVIGLISDRKRKLSIMSLYVITLIIGLFLLDIGCVYFMKFKPIFAVSIKSSDHFKTYNSILYRQFECDNKIYTDFLYRKSNYCKSSLLEEKDINSLSSDIINNFKNYKNKFYIIDAKVSYKEGNNKLDLKSYTVNNDDSINGTVIFNDNIIYKCYLFDSSNIDSIKVYDNVKVVGRISSIKKDDDVYTITMNDAYLISDNNYDEFSINVVENRSCDKDKTEYVETKENRYYTSCLSNVYVVYNNDVYDLNYVLKDEKIKLKDLLKDYENKEVKELEDKEYDLYEYEKYNILVCNDNVIIGNKKLSLENNYCDVKEPDENDL